MKKFKFRICLVCLIPLLIFILNCGSQTEISRAEKPASGEQLFDSIPGIVMNALMAKFPNAEVQKWTKETEDDSILYDIEFKQGEQKFEADIKEDGTFHNWEKEITYMQLPEAVQKAVEKQYPEAAIVEIMETSATKEGKDLIEEYEIVLGLSDTQKIEMTFAPNGEILEGAENIE